MDMVLTLGGVADGGQATGLALPGCGLGLGTAAGMAAEIIAAEAADFHWQARVAERYLGEYESLDDDEDPLDRVAVLGCLDGCWYVAAALVDGEGRVHHLEGLRRFASAWDAHGAYAEVA